ncbi:MAG: cell division protein FtsZ [Anaplasmataceae bacterium]|nr:cell division protein FtsZ [Anaplasmataceae bacterium]
MVIDLKIPSDVNHFSSPKLGVCGVGGAGSNAVANMLLEGLVGVKTFAANTDAQALEKCTADMKIHIGQVLTKGLGAGSVPQIGKEAAEESAEEIAECIDGLDMLFITAGLGGGTGTGASPVIAKIAQEKGILTVAVATKPFNFEGRHRMKVACAGLEELRKYVDTYLIISNQHLFRIANEKTTLADAFKMADSVLNAGVRDLTDLMISSGYINLDFADVASILRKKGLAIMGTGEASGENRATKAAEIAIFNPLLDNVSIDGASGILINVTGGMDMTLFEMDEAVNKIKDEVNEDANIIFGSTFNENIEGIRVSIFATGLENEKDKQGNGDKDSNSIISTAKDNANDQDNKMEIIQEKKTNDFTYFDTPAFLRRKK